MSKRFLVDFHNQLILNAILSRLSDANIIKFLNLLSSKDFSSVDRFLLSCIPDLKKVIRSLHSDHLRAAIHA